jgi:hypothetical protein
MTSKTLPAPEAALRLRLSREQTIRRIQTGDLKGGRDDRGWFVLASELPAELGDRESTPPQ